MMLLYQFFKNSIISLSQHLGDFPKHRGRGQVQLQLLSSNFQSSYPTTSYLAPQPLLGSLRATIVQLNTFSTLYPTVFAVTHLSWNIHPQNSTLPTMLALFHEA